MVQEITELKKLISKNLMGEIDRESPPHLFHTLIHEASHSRR